MQALLPHLSLARYQCEYAHKLYTVIEDVMPASWCADVVARCQEQIAAGTVLRVSPETRREGDAPFVPGPYEFHMFTGTHVRRDFKEVDALYLGWRWWAAAITLQHVVLSPHKNLTSDAPSDIFSANIKVYPANGKGELSGHRDRNSVTCLLYLTDCGGGGLVLKPDLPNAQEDRILPRAGRMVLMQGQRCYHYSEPTCDVPKAVAVMNYFAAENVELPNWSESMERGILASATA